MIIGCTGNYRKKEYFTILEKIFKLVSDSNTKFLISDDLKKNTEIVIPNYYQLVKFEDIIMKADILLAIGGDGTILSTVRRMGLKQIPIMGIHIGGLGFLSEITEEDLEFCLTEILKKNFFISNRMLIEVGMKNKNNNSNSLKKYWALNDIVIDHGTSARVLKIKVNISGNYLNTYEGDGLIIATPTGSTAYSLSAGGPIIYPELDTIAVTPICPHSLSARPIVLRDIETITIEILSPDDGMALAIDGQICFSINKNTILNISKGKYYAKMVNIKKDKYFLTLRNKMGWSGNLR